MVEWLHVKEIKKWVWTFLWAINPTNSKHKFLIPSSESRKENCMATVKFAFTQNQQLQQHCCVFIIYFLTFLVCEIWWFSFCSLQSYTPTLLFHRSQACRGQTYSWIFVCTWGVFLHKIGVFKKNIEKKFRKEILRTFSSWWSLWNNLSQLHSSI